MASTLFSLAVTGLLDVISLQVPQPGFLYFYLTSTLLLVGYRRVL